MLVKESYLRKVIRESLLLEAVYKQKQLKELSPELYAILDRQFLMNDNTQSLENEKSAGRFFIDALYFCMQELLGEFDPETESENAEFIEKVEDICSHLIYLFYQKEVTSSRVQSGETFRDYIYAFMTSPKNFVIKNQEGRETRDIISKIKTIFLNVSARASMTGVNRILQLKEQLKRKDTAYPFGNELVDGKYLVVQPLSMMSSIFWSRTNYLAEKIVLPKQNDISWCTSRYESNMFNTYFIGGGTNLFYFLPKDDMIGKQKSCVGLTKIVQNDEEIITIGGHTTVNFRNIAIIPESQKVSSNVLSRVSKKLDISMETLNRLVDEMALKEAMDKYKYVSLIDLPQFKAVTNLNTLAPINEKTNERNKQDLKNIKDQIDNIINTYDNPEYSKKGYKPDNNIVNYMFKNYSYWKAEGITLNITKLTLLQNPALKQSQEFLDECVENFQKYKAESSFSLSAFDKNIVFNKEFLTSLLQNEDKRSLLSSLNFEDMPYELKNDLDFAKFFVTHLKDSLKTFANILIQDKEYFKKIIEVLFPDYDSIDFNSFRKCSLYKDYDCITHIALYVPEIINKYLPEYLANPVINYFCKFPLYNDEANNNFESRSFNIHDKNEIKEYYKNQNESFRKNKDVVFHILVTCKQADFIESLDESDKFDIFEKAFKKLNEKDGQKILENLTVSEKDNEKFAENFVRLNFIKLYKLYNKKISSRGVLHFFSERIRNDKNFIERNRLFLFPKEYGNEVLQDLNFLKSIISSPLTSEEETFKEIKNVSGFIRNSLEYWPESIKANEEMCKFFVDINKYNFSYVKNLKLKKDENFILSTLSDFHDKRITHLANSWKLDITNEEEKKKIYQYLNNNKIDVYFYNIVEAFYKNMSKSLRENKDFIIKLLKVCPFNIFIVDKNYRNDIDIAKIVLKIFPDAKKYLDPSIKSMLTNESRYRYRKLIMTETELRTLLKRYL